MNSKIPLSEKEILVLHFKLGSPPALIFHCHHVTAIALEICKQIRLASPNIEIDEEIITMGALAHDLGRNITNGISHAIEGAKILKKYFIGSQVDEVAKIVERHIGAGIPKEETEVLNLPFKDFIPLTLNEKIVCYADKLADYKFNKTNKSWTIDKWFTFNSISNEYDKLAKKLGTNHLVLKRLKDLENEIISFNNSEKFDLSHLDHITSDL